MSFSESYLGYNAPVPGSEESKADGFTTVLMKNLERGAEPAYLAKDYLGGSLIDRGLVKEIHCQPHGTTAYVTLTTPEVAEVVAQVWDGKPSMSRYSHTGGIIRVEGVKEDQIPETHNLCWTEYIADKKKPLHTKTVELINMPANGLGGWDGHIEELVAPIDEKHEFIPSYRRTSDSTVLVHMDTVSAAEAIVEWCEGHYFKNATIYAHCVPDERYEEIIQWEEEERENRVKKAGKDIQLIAFMQNPTPEKVKEIFDPFPLQNINIPAKGGSARVFMTPYMAAGWFARNKKGVKYRGQWISIKLAKDKKGNVPEIPNLGVDSEPPVGLAHMSVSQARSALAQHAKDSVEGVVTAGDLAKKAHHSGPTDIKVENIAFDATKTDVQALFKTFKTTKLIHNKKGGFAWVGFNTRADAERAVASAKGRLIRGRAVTATVNGPSPPKPAATPKAGKAPGTKPAAEK